MAQFLENGNPIVAKKIAKVKNRFCLYILFSSFIGLSKVKLTSTYGAVENRPTLSFC